MKMKLSTLLISLLIVSASLAAQPQMHADSIRSMLVKDWQRAKEYTLEFIAAMPEDGINAKPSPEIRSFAEQMLHLSQGSIGLVANGTGKERIYQGQNLEQTEEFKNKEALTKVVTESYDFCINALKEMDVSMLGETVERGRFKVSRLGWINKGFEHQTHHRGQCVVYLRMQNVKPPNEKLF